MYFDLDDILADSQKFQGKFTVNLDNVNFLVNSNDDKLIISNKDKIEIPFWLLRSLSTIFLNDRESIFNVERPEIFGYLAINFFKASPNNADLSILQYFYKIVLKWCSFIEEPILVNTVYEMLISRSGKINDFSFNLNENYSKENEIFLQSLDVFEKELYRCCVASYSDTRVWLKNVRDA